jgi:hypothetical protein
LTLLFRWVDTWDIAAFATSTSCVTITTDVSTSYVEDDPLLEGRSMGNLILLPDGTIFCLNGAATGKCTFFFTLHSVVCLIYAFFVRERRIWQHVVGYWPIVREQPDFKPGLVQSQSGSGAEMVEEWSVA